MSAVDDPLKRLQWTPLGAVLPPNGKSHTCHRSSSVYETEDWDALEVELASDGWPYRAPNSGSPWPQVTLLTGLTAY